MLLISDYMIHNPGKGCKCYLVIPVMASGHINVMAATAAEEMGVGVGVAPISDL